ncbi:MAG: hypothetical protein H0U75_06615 [Legionella sp.]|nr:hypothetical protein [Legionella sp.]
MPKTVANTQPGIDYQIHLGMFMGLLYAVEHNTSFELRTEVQEEGKFDDLVITLPTGVVAIQSKYHLGISSYDVKDFINKSSEINLRIHFDSLFKNPLFRKNQIQLRPQWLKPQQFDNPANNFCLISNYDAAPKLKRYIGQDGHLTLDFYQSADYHDIVDNINTNSEAIRHDPYFSVYIKRFLEKLEINFNFYNREQLKEDIKRKIKLKYNTKNDAIYHAFFHEFYDWTISQQPNTWSNADIISLLDNWYAKYISLERLCGLTEFRVQRVASKLIYNFQRQDEMATLRTFCEEKKNKFLILFGEGGMGKTTIVQEYYKEMHPIDGEMLFLSLYELLSWENLESITQLGLIKVIFIDDTELVFNNDLLLAQLKNCLIKIASGVHIKLVLLTRTEKRSELVQLITQYSSPSQLVQLEIQSLPIKAVIEGIKQTSEKNPLLIANILVLHDQIKNEEGRSLLTIPFYLTLFLLNPKNYYGQSDLNYQLIDALINKQEEVKKEGGVDKEGIKGRKSILRKLLLNKEQSREDMVLPVDIDNANLKSLTADNIIFLRDNRVYFSHRYYEEWTVDYLLKKEITRFTEGQEHPKKAVKHLAARLKNYYTYSVTATTTAQIELYSQTQLFPVFQETVEYFIEKRNTVALCWLQAHFVKPIQSMMMELIESKPTTDKQVKCYLETCQTLYLHETQTIIEHLENSSILLEFITDIYFAMPFRDKWLESFLKEAELTIINEVYDFPDALQQILLKVVAIISRDQTRYFPISYIFLQEALSSMYQLLRGESKLIYWDESDVTLWSTEIDITDFLENEVISIIIGDLVSCLINHCKIEDIELTHLNLNDNAIEQICDALINSEISSLNELNLHDNNISDEGVEFILAMSEKCKLKRLCLGYNESIGDLGARHLAKLIVFLPEFIYCDLSGTDISPDGAGFLELACKHRQHKFGLELTELSRCQEKGKYFYYKQDKRTLIMWAIEDEKIDFLKNYLELTDIDLSEKFNFYDTDNEEICKSPLEYARELYEEPCSMMKVLLSLNKKKTLHSNKTQPVPKPPFSQAPVTIAPKASHFSPVSKADEQQQIGLQKLLLLGS